MSTPNICYYAVQLPSGIVAEERDKLIFNDKIITINIAKKYKGSRFKAFHTYEEALEFSQKPLLLDAIDITSPCVKALEIERLSSPHRSPHTRDLTKLRRSIEKGDCDEVERCIEQNPRYLVGPGDTPVILMEGPRYNAFHVAAKSGQANALKLVLNKISSVKFIQFLYPCDNEETALDRINFILDLYLNTPDKGACETPLHFACKFGNVDVVKLLLEQPGCDITKRNKLDQSAKEIICERKGDSNVKEKMTKLFDSNRRSKLTPKTPLQSLTINDIEQQLQKLTIGPRRLFEEDN